jgi:hypothetical protein
MRTFGTFLAVGTMALTVGCGGSSSTGIDGGGGATGGGGGISGNGGAGSSGFTSTTGRTVASGGLECKGQSCAAKDTYYACAAKCDADAKICFGPSYASGTFSGACQSFITCTMACPCDSTGATCLQTCYAAVTADCVTCLSTASTCGVTNGCGAQPPTCPSDAATSTGTNCATLAACCPTMAAAAGMTVQQCQAGIAGLPDATCAQQLASANSLGLCQ